MVATGIIAINDERYLTIEGSTRGCGKTTTAVYYAYQNYVELGHTVYANIHLNFARYLTTDQIVHKILNEDLANVTIIFDEFHLYLNSLGEPTEKVKLVTALFYQSRKSNVDIFACWIRFTDVQIRVRQQFDNILMPQKYHYELNEFGEVIIGDLCPMDRCNEKHIIQVYSYKPRNLDEPIIILNPKEISDITEFNTFERVNEKDAIWKKKKKEMDDDE